MPRDRNELDATYSTSKPVRYLKHGHDVRVESDVLLRSHAELFSYSNRNAGKCSRPTLKITRPVLLSP